MAVDLVYIAHGFIPGLSIPVETQVPLNAAAWLLCISIFTLTLENPKYVLLRLALAPAALYFFWDYGFGPYVTPGVIRDTGLSVIGLYGIMRVLETTFVGLFDEKPPYWITDGKALPLPKTLSQRLAYALDLTTSLRGTSWFKNTHWNFAPRVLVNSPTRNMTRKQFLLSGLTSLLWQQIILDVLDTINKSRSWSSEDPYPITSLPWYEQLVFSFSVCAGTALSITIPHCMVSCTCVLLGSYPESWPPMFDAPFTAYSLADFWTRRWHAIFRRVFDRLASGILQLLHLPRWTSQSILRHIRAIVIFGLSASLHIMLMYRADMRETEHPRTFVDPSILKFFLSQPLGLAVEALVIIPFCNAFLPASWMKVVTRAWAWAFLLFAGRFWSDVWVHRGFWHERERVVGFSVVRGLLYDRWII
ncbi:hypothetical protein PLICRDRAFT_37757 [Plicaturopsis crispa FD-325 SS-3]|nr:hypothetical protein PLICRDRAFT_37757 [Plicaturopsis crispa FD-325 SS-3]